MTDRDADYTDDAVARWAELLPDVPLETIQITMRTRRAAAFLTEIMTDVVVQHGLRALGDYEVLSAVRRSPTPLTPSDLADRLLATRSAITGRLDRLESAELVQRRSDTADGRSLTVVLTRRGRRLTDRILRASLGRQLAIVDQVDPDHRAHLETGLRALMLVLDDRPGNRP